MIDEVLKIDLEEFRQRAKDLRSDLDAGASASMDEIAEALGLEPYFVAASIEVMKALQSGQPVTILPLRKSGEAMQ